MSTYLKSLWLVMMGYINRLSTWLRYQYLRQLKLTTTQAREATLTDLRDEDIVYRSEDFVVVNKRWDVRINSEDPRHTVTLSKQLAYKLPETADNSVTHQYRYLLTVDNGSLYNPPHCTIFYHITQLCNMY